MLMRYLNTLTGNEIVADSEIFAPHYVKIDEDVAKPAEEKTTKPKKATTKKGAKK